MADNIGLIPLAKAAAMKDVPEQFLDNFMIQNSVMMRVMPFMQDGYGLQYPILGKDGDPVAKFVGAEDGFDKSFAAITTAYEYAHKIGFNIEVTDEALRKSRRTFKAYTSFQIQQHLSAAAKEFDACNFYGGLTGTAYEASPYRGRHARMIVGSSMIIDAGGAGTGGYTSVYLDVYGQEDTHGFLDVDEDGATSLLQNNIHIFKNVPILGKNNKEMVGHKVMAQGYYGLAVHNAKSMGQIYKISNDKPLTKALIDQLLAKCDLDSGDRRSRAVIHFNSRGKDMLNADLMKDIVPTSMQEYTNLEIYRYNGVLLVVNSAISDNEPAKPTE